MGNKNAFSFHSKWSKDEQTNPKYLVQGNSSSVHI